MPRSIDRPRRPNTLLSAGLLLLIACCLPALLLYAI